MFYECFFSLNPFYDIFVNILQAWLKFIWNSPNKAIYWLSQNMVSRFTVWVTYLHIQIHISNIPVGRVVSGKLSLTERHTDRQKIQVIWGFLFFLLRYKILQIKTIAENNKVKGKARFTPLLLNSNAYNRRKSENHSSAL